MAAGRSVLVLGTAGWPRAESILAWLAFSHCVRLGFRRAQGITACSGFWSPPSLVVLLVPTAFQTHDTLFDQAILSA
jgi:hypothetical protein